MAYYLTLKDARTRASLTQDALARRAKVSQSLISLLERGGGKPYRHTVVKLARALAINPSRLTFPEPVQPQAIDGGGA